MSENTVAEWYVIEKSVQGKSHVRTDTPNQDYVGHSSPLESPLIVAVSDGHGSPKCVRSNNGSHAAVACAIKAIICLFRDLGTGVTLSTVKHIAEDQLPRRIVDEWNQFVTKDMEARPFSNTESEKLKQLTETEQAAIAKRPAIAYGATLVVAVIAPTYLLYLQIGDGDILVVHEDGTVVQPIEKDPRLIANETTSLSLVEAYQEFRVTFQPRSGRDPAMIWLSTDGYSNAFKTAESFCKVGSDVLEMFRTQGLKSVEDDVEGWLNESSAYTGDDVSVVMAVRRNALASSNPLNTTTEQPAPPQPPISESSEPQITDVGGATAPIQPAKE